MSGSRPRPVRANPRTDTRIPVEFHGVWDHRSPAVPCAMARTLFTASGGGHLAELVTLSRRLPFDVGFATWFTQDTVQARSVLAGEQVVWADPAPPRDWRAALRNARLACAMARRFRFDFAVSTGASMAVSALPAAQRYGAKAIYIESAARVEGPSLSGRILAAYPGPTTFSQHRSWAGGHWSYAGSVLDSFEPGPDVEVSELRRVVVTLGSQQDYSFHRLVARLARVLPSGTDVLWQTGSTDGHRHGIEGVEFVASDVLDAAMAQADLVIAHAGVGSALAAFGSGRHPLLVPRRASYGEHVDDHQVQIAAELGRRGLATVCGADELTLDVLLGAARKRVVARVGPPTLDLGPLPQRSGLPSPAAA